MIQKIKIESILIQLSGQMTVNGTVKTIGLMNETTGLGLKRRLRKIQKELGEEWQQYIIDLQEIDKIEDAEEKKKETDRLLSETFELHCELAMMSEIEKIESDFNYDWDLIELIAK